MLHETLTSLSPQCQRWVSMPFLGGLGRQLSWVFRAMEQAYQWPGTAQLPLLAPHRARFCPEELYMATNWNIHSFWWLDTCFPFCRCYCHFLRYGETQQPFLGIDCPANWISRLQSSKPKARVQERVHHIDIPGVSKFPSAFAVPVVGRSFPVAWAERGWTRDIFCSCFLKTLPIPLQFRVAVLEPSDFFPLQDCSPWTEFPPQLLPYNEGEPDLHAEGYSSSWNAGWGCCSLRERLSCTWAPLSRDISRGDSTGEWDPDPLNFLTWGIPSSHFSTNLLLLHRVSESPFGIFRDWKSSLVLNFLLKINK